MERGANACFCGEFFPFADFDCEGVGDFFSQVIEGGFANEFAANVALDGIGELIRWIEKWALGELFSNGLKQGIDAFIFEG